MVGPIDADWYCEQVEQFKPTMFRVAYAILHCEADCEDAASSAVLRGYRYLSTLQSRDGFRSWMLRILKNECFNILYRRQLFEPMPPWRQSMETTVSSSASSSGWCFASSSIWSV